MTIDELRQWIGGASDTINNSSSDTSFLDVIQNANTQAKNLAAQQARLKNQQITQAINDTYSQRRLQLARSLQQREDLQNYLAGKLTDINTKLSTTNSDQLAQAAARGASGNSVASSALTNILQSQMSKNEAQSTIDAQEQTSLLNDQNINLSTASKVNALNNSYMTQGNLNSTLNNIDLQFGGIANQYKNQQLNNSKADYQQYIEELKLT